MYLWFICQAAVLLSLENRGGWHGPSFPLSLVQMQISEPIVVDFDFGI